MSTAALLVATVLYVVHSLTLDCTQTPSECKTTTITCAQDEDCMIDCNEEQSCLSSTINCPYDGDCGVTCQGWESCKDLTINASHTIRGNLLIMCEGSEDHCHGISVLGSTVDTFSGYLNMDCNGDSAQAQSCMNSHIRCPVAGRCDVQCNAERSCFNANITGPVEHDFSVDCNEPEACERAHIDGRHASQMEIRGCISEESCAQIVLYCPQMRDTDGLAVCFIQGNENVGVDTAIYAVNGWLDVEMEYSGEYGDHHGGSMHCGEAYDIWCHLADEAWSCSDPSHSCNGLVAEIQTTSLFVEGIVMNQTLPDLSGDFEHGSMGMLIIAGGLIAVAVACILAGFVKHAIVKHGRKNEAEGGKKKHAIVKQYRSAKSQSRAEVDI